MDNGPSEVIPINIGLILLGPVSMLMLNAPKYAFFPSEARPKAERSLGNCVEKEENGSKKKVPRRRRRRRRRPRFLYPPPISLANLKKSLKKFLF